VIKGQRRVGFLKEDLFAIETMKGKELYDERIQEGEPVWTERPGFHNPYPGASLGCWWS
jgi:hypothetical protein